MHRFLIVIEKAKKTIRHTLRISWDAEKQEKHAKKLKNGCMKRYKMHIRGLVKRRTTGPEITFLCILWCESRRE